MTTWATTTKSPSVTTYLLAETGDFLLQENGDKIVLAYGGWGNITKTASSWTQTTKS